MRTGPPLPMRTEDDVRAALAAMERRAPSAEAVLDAVRNAAGRHRPSLARPLRSPRSPRWLHRPGLVIAIAAAAAAAGLAIALLPGGAPPGTGGAGPDAASRAGLPSAATVGKAMLTAFSAANDDILYSTETGINRGVLVDVYRDWSWPAQPVPGQQERWREAFSQRISRAKPLTLTEDDGFVYTAPPASANNVYGQLTVVCYAGTGQTSCGYGNTDTPAGTWSLHHGQFINPNPGLDDLSPATLAQDIVKGLWRVTRRTRVDGQQAIELTETPAGYYQPLPTLLWVNAHTYLPLRMINGAGSTVTQSDWHYLKPTTANLALLQVPIPAGYPRSGSPSADRFPGSR